VNCASAEGQQLHAACDCIVSAGGEEATGPAIEDIAAQVSAHTRRNTYSMLHDQTTVLALHATTDEQSRHREQ